MLSQVIYYCRDYVGLTRDFFGKWDTPTLLRNGRVNGQINAFRSQRSRIKKACNNSSEGPSSSLGNLSRIFFGFSKKFYNFVCLSFYLFYRQVKNGVEDRILGAIGKRGFDRLASSICRKKRGQHSTIDMFLMENNGGGDHFSLVHKNTSAGTNA